MPEIRVDINHAVVNRVKFVQVFCEGIGDAIDSGIRPIYQPRDLSGMQKIAGAKELPAEIEKSLFALAINGIINILKTV
jgi:hypothetical protein